MALGEGSLNPADISFDDGVRHRLCVVRDGPRFVILSTRK